jgi:DNA-directed RNA polymerase specialized sigma24 family protein
LQSLVVACDAPCEELLSLSEALGELERRDPRKHQIVMLRFFAGLSTAQVADATETSLRTVQREWRYSRAWLHRQLSEPPPASA